MGIDVSLSNKRVKTVNKRERERENNEDIPRYLEIFLHLSSLSHKSHVSKREKGMGERERKGERKRKRECTFNILREKHYSSDRG
jgi:hypothetical protein